MFYVVCSELYSSSFGHRRRLGISLVWILHKTKYLNEVLDEVKQCSVRGQVSLFGATVPSQQRTRPVTNLHAHFGSGNHLPHPPLNIHASCDVLQTRPDSCNPFFFEHSKPTSDPYRYFGFLGIRVKWLEKTRLPPPHQLKPSSHHPI